jgi:hypothetical protein
MKENVSQELDALRGMLNNWKTGFMGWASPDGDNDHVILEFTEEIQNNLYPYVRRLFETKHLNEVEAKEFMCYCFGQVEDLRQQLREVKTNEN